MIDYRYTESGLNNVTIRGMNVPVDDADDEVYCIPNILGLHKVIAQSIVTKPHGITGAELRFLRTEMGLTQAEMAEMVKKDHQTLGRWERGDKTMDQNAEFAIRMLAKERLQLDVTVSVEEMLRSCVPSAQPGMIVIDGSDPNDYKLAA
jgi:DNA-binding transcriptional regulator YiaG